MRGLIDDQRFNKVKVYECITYDHWLFSRASGSEGSRPISNLQPARSRACPLLLLSVSHHTLSTTSPPPTPRARSSVVLLCHLISNTGPNASSSLPSTRRPRPLSRQIVRTAERPAEP